MNRRQFLFGAGAAFLVPGCRTRSLFGTPNMTFGVISDIHITTWDSCALFEKSLGYFRRRGADAVMIPGDLTDWGLLNSIKMIKAVWDRVFAGTDTVMLECTGNHDFDGWAYTDVRAHMQAAGFDGSDHLTVGDRLPEHWKAVFGDFEWFRCRTVKGYDFVSGEWYGYKTIEKRMAEFGDRFNYRRPFFYFQHPPIKGTTKDGDGWADGGIVKPVLDRYPNCIAFTGHSHRTFNDERQIWQGEFTAIGTPSLSYSCVTGKDHERNNLSTRLEERGGQGYFVSVWDDRVVVERIDLEEEDSDLPAWVIPLGTKERPYANEPRERSFPAPVFPTGAKVFTCARNDDTAERGWRIVRRVEVPKARMPNALRVLDYEVRFVPVDGSAPVVTKFYSPAYSRMERFEPERQVFDVDAKRLPAGRDFVVEVRARNCWGRCSEPIRSGVVHTEPFAPYKKEK